MRASQRLERHLRACAEDADWPVEEPLPTTRSLAKRFGLSAATAFRLLKSLEEREVFWQHTSGRFYKTAARPILDRPRPVACLIRRLELCSALYRELLEGISAGSGEARRAMLLWHDDVLVNHADPMRAPVFAGENAQRLLLADFLQRHGDGAGGYLFDHLWNEKVLAKSAGRIQPAGVMLFRRPKKAGFLGAAYADFASAATQGLTHLLERGFERIVPVEPFGGDPAVADFMEALGSAAKVLHCEARLAAKVRVETPEEAGRLIKKLSGKKRCALLVPEDHTALRLWAALEAAGRSAGPQAIGVLTVMGTVVSAHAGLSRLRFDYHAMGKTAVAMLGESTPRLQAFPAVLHQGIST